MIMRYLIGAGLACVLLLAPTGCSQAGYVHTVFFTMAPDSSDTQIQGFVHDCHEMLKRVPTVTKFEAGRRDTLSTREFNEVEFDVGLVVRFEDKAGLDGYIDDPAHVELVEKYKDAWTRILVYDFIVE